MYYNEKSNLINEDIPSEDGIQKLGRCSMLKYYHILIIIMMTSSIVFQAISFFYLYEIGMAAKNIDMYTVNQSDTQEYINKLKKIINYICVNEGIC